MLTLKMDQDPLTLIPGQKISGTFGWSLTEDPKDAGLRLFWYTEGKGTQDVGIVEEESIGLLRRDYESPFEFTIPHQPYSFQGTLITVKWALELVLDGGKEFERIELVVSPWTEQVALKKYKEEARL